MKPSPGPDIRVPGDKSIAHRILLLAPLARGESRLRGLPDSEDVARTAAALRAVGAEIAEIAEGGIVVAGPAGFREPGEAIDCGNSGTTARLLTGLLAGLGLPAVLDGDASLRARPMDRVVYPLQAMGARISYAGKRDRLPLRLEGRASGSLRPLRHRPRVASAQVKSSLLLAGLTARVRVEVIEPGRSRDHTERLLRAMGAPVTFGPEGEGARALLDPGGRDAPLRPLDLRVPGDPSSAAFLVGAALLARRPLRVRGVCLNPTRTGFLDVLREAGAGVRAAADRQEGGEPVGDIAVNPGPLRAFEIGPERIPSLLDEVPLLAVLAARSEGTSRIRGAEELRVKESDRLARLAAGLRAVGVRCRELPDGLDVEGTGRPLEGTVATGGDHRIAMAFGVLARSPGARIRIDDRRCAAISFPGFWTTLDRVAGEDTGGSVPEKPATGAAREERAT